jgi:hypothetical protein
VAANFVGNLTSINSPDADIMALAQQPDCSLTLRPTPFCRVIEKVNGAFHVDEVFMYPTDFSAMK